MSDEDISVGKDLLTWMILSRSVEDQLAKMYRQSRLRGRIISGRGQEATAVGAASAAEENDLVAPVHRDLGVHLVRGTPVLDIFRHYLGRETGPSSGRDGDIHMGRWDLGVFPMVSHLPDSWPIMVGASLAFKLRNEPRVVIAFCGDGATSTGTWHESMNFAAVFGTPTVFVVENNGYAYSTPAKQQFRIDHLVDRAQAYGMAGARVDGNDALAVHQVVSAAVAEARSGNGPWLVEATTFRMDGHAIHDDASYVPHDLREEWSRRDPIKNLAKRLISTGAIGTSEVKEMEERSRRIIADAVRQAESESEPDPNTITSRVYAGE